MRDSLALHLALFRRQRAQIARVVDGQTDAFRSYEARYRRRTASYRRVLPLTEVHQRVRASDVVYVGDYHTLPLAQQTYLELVERALTSGRRVVLALECIEGRHQASLDAWRTGRLSERSLLARLGGETEGAGFGPGTTLRTLLAFARRHRLEVVGIDRRAQGERSLALRDAYAAERIARVARAEDRPLVLVLVGQYHVAPCHLPTQVERALGDDTRRGLVVYQNAEGVWWRLARDGRMGVAEAVELADDTVCLLNASPVVCQQSFLDYLEAEAGDSPLMDRGASERFREMAALIGRLAGVPVVRALESVEVATVADGDVLARIQRRGRFTQAELSQLRRHILSRESSYIPRARTAYLASLSLNHAAEEAAHFVRHCAVGSAMEAPRTASDAFYARCMEEALGFFGSRLVNPRRTCLGLAEWAKRFGESRGVERQVSAFVLAHKAAELEAPEEAVKLLPLRKDRLFHGVSHALGYLLGDRLYRAFDEGRLAKAEVRALFRDPFVEARTVYFTWAERLRD
ncbi:ChaN family lipoprotein [Myxococcus sp. CA051A]|uniref:ChaN family lipoprotein n=1 Tax=unclassified Myxococcus TaxID=2648731 RepID=UPI00157A21A7|nr:MULTISPECIES: ChaN family lipoprotein [unclassified Myxococcus]NTX14508.1 ChaN family lipoprotein [Myxococcus sp. CA056]NTX41086.1 ChaN family lipoprotein [Myxococcus sp. CA033]NTX53807.1 ChaN family lipoprotein [Myxococcus sp. CA039A]NTX64256.1 ChaN family lipoprotein [Myxococcus sp. CA051A]